MSFTALVPIVRRQRAINRDRNRVIAEEFLRLANAFEENLTYISSHLYKLEVAAQTADYNAESVMLLNKANHVLYSMGSEIVRLANFRGLPRPLHNKLMLCCDEVYGRLGQVVEGPNRDPAEFYEALARFKKATAEIRAYFAKRAP